MAATRDLAEFAISTRYAEGLPPSHRARPPGQPLAPGRGRRRSGALALAAGRLAKAWQPGTKALVMQRRG